MREILFRGWVSGTKSWGYSFSPDGVSEESQFEPVTVSSYINLDATDGEKIFEGDIVYCEMYRGARAAESSYPASKSPLHWTGCVRMENGCWAMGGYLIGDVEGRLLILGNYFDHRELAVAVGDGVAGRIFENFKLGPLVERIFNERNII